MPRKSDYFPTFRRNPRRERQIAEIGERIGAPGEFASVIDYALAKTLEEDKSMKGYEISGRKGTYLELEDGRFADTVSGDGEDLETLRKEITEHVTRPMCTSMSVHELIEYVGAD